MPREDCFDSAAIESKPIESATAGTVSGVQIAVVGIFSAASSSSYWVMLPHSSLEHDSLIRTPIKGVRKPISDLSGYGSTLVANERLSDSSPGPVVELDPRPTRRSFLLGTVKQASKASAEARIHTGNFKGGKDPGLPEALRARMLALEDEVNMVMGQYLGAVEGAISCHPLPMVQEREWEEIPNPNRRAWKGIDRNDYNETHQHHYLEVEKGAVGG
ncbi:hypothetical protein HN51_040857 [Arachis hypogaea]